MTPRTLSTVYEMGVVVRSGDTGTSSLVFLAGRPRPGGVRSALPLHHFVDPDRGERRRASFGNGIVAIDPQLFTDGDRPLAVLGEVDADFRQAHVHRPFHFGNGGR